MKKHVYLHSSNLDNLKIYKKDLNFIPAYEYDINMRCKYHEYEYGSIQTIQNFYHIIAGQLTQENCPWCGHTSKLNKFFDGDYIKPSKYCMQCINCGSRGPVLNVNKEIEVNYLEMQEIVYLIKRRFETRRQWDSDLEIKFEDNDQ